MAAMAPGGHGAYGLNLFGPFGAAGLIESSPSWVNWRIVVAAAPPAEQVPRWDRDAAACAVLPSGWATFDRAGATTHLFLPAPLTQEWLLHPLLSSTAVMSASWLGRQAFHAGAFVLDGRAWGVLGDRNHGKSTLLASMHQRGLPILADDVLVLQDGRAMAGPRCLDLREGAAAALGIGVPLGVLGSRERWRVTLGPVPAEVPFAGWVTLEWGPEVAISSVPLPSRLAVLAGAQGLKTLAQEGTAAWLPLIGAPMLTLTRPRSFERQGEAIGALVDALTPRAPG